MKKSGNHNRQKSILHQDVQGINNYPDITKNNQGNPEHQKMITMGIQGSGKTTYAIEHSKHHGYETLVYTPHPTDFAGCGDNFVVVQGDMGNYAEDFDTLMHQVVEMGQVQEKEEIKYFDTLIIDEMDLILQSNFDFDFSMNFITTSHRHLKIAVHGVTRRPQDIPTKILESSMYQVIFSIDGHRVRKKLDKMYKDMGTLVTQLEKDKYEYVLKKLGKNPEVYKHKI